MHRDVYRRLRKIAKDTGYSRRDVSAAMVLLGLNMYYHLQDGKEVKLIRPEAALQSALDRARGGNQVDSGRREYDSEDAARQLSWQIERETGSE